MKHRDIGTLFRRAALTLFSAICLLNCRAGNQEGIQNLYRIDLLPRYMENTVVRQISSYDTTGGNDDGFSGKYSFLRKEKNNLVIADLKGPGIIQRIWTPTPTEDTISFYFDNEANPRISMKFIDLFSGDHYPFIRPICGNEVGGYYCYLPIPYKSSCKIIYRGATMQFFQIGYYEMKGNSSISTFSEQFSVKEKEELQLAVKAWKSTGKELLGLLPVQGIKSKTSTVLIKPGQTAKVFDMNSGGRIVGIEVVPSRELNRDFKDILLRALWDGEKVPSINCPVSDFFGYAFGRPSVQSMLLGVKNGVHYCYFPMPFENKAVLELVSVLPPGKTAEEISCKITVYYTDIGKKKNEGRFYSKWNRTINPEMNKPYTFLERGGRGHYAGTMLQAQGLNPGMTVFFEGDDVCRIDGEQRIHGTGSEDYFNGGWYALPDRWDQAFSLPVHGSMAYSIPLAHTGGYRFYISDKLPFEGNIEMTIEHGGENNIVPVDYTSVAFYYCETSPPENNTPSIDLLEAVKPPSLMEYWIQLLPVKALGGGAILKKETRKDSKSGESVSVLRMEAGMNGYVKFELEVPGDGEYNLYLSYFKGADCSTFAVNQRQIPVNTGISAFEGENTFIRKEFIGKLFIREGTNTITVVLKENPPGAERGSFVMNKIFLEKI
jgi:hypothetical protein